MIRLLLLSMLIFFAGESIPSAEAKPLIADISIHEIRIDSGFTGTEVLLFGARNDIGDVLVILRGPEQNFVVRKKERVAGIWINRTEDILKSVPEFFATASTRRMDEIRNPTLLSGLQLTGQSLFGARESLSEFQEAFLRQRFFSHLYPETGSITFMGESLFKTVIPIPENIPRGTYTAEVYLINEEQLAGMQTTPLWITKTGFDAFVFDLAHEHPYLYGMLAIVLALTAGWGASTIFNRR